MDSPASDFDEPYDPPCRPARPAMPTPPLAPDSPEPAVQVFSTHYSFYHVDSRTRYYRQSGSVPPHMSRYWGRFTSMASPASSTSSLEMPYDPPEDPNARRMPLPPLADSCPTTPVTPFANLNSFPEAYIERSSLSRHAASSSRTDENRFRRSPSSVRQPSDDENRRPYIRRCWRRTVGIEPDESPCRLSSSSCAGPHRSHRSVHHSRSHAPYPSPNTAPAPSPSPPPSPSPRSPLAPVSPRRPKLQFNKARMEKVDSLHDIPAAASDDTCPVCGYVNYHKPDLKRHIAGHSESTKHVCCGVPLSRADECGVVDRDGACMWNGELRVGGCWRVFSRRDALLRHWKNSKNTCARDVPATGRTRAKRD